MNLPMFDRGEQPGRESDAPPTFSSLSGGYQRATPPPPPCDKFCPCPDHQRGGTGLVVYVPDDHDQQKTESSL